MILRLTSPNRQLTICSTNSIVQVTPNLKGCKVTTSNGNFDVLESVEDVFKLWHDSCTNITNISTNIVAEKNSNFINTNTNSNNSNNSVGAVGEGKVLLLNNMPIPVDSSVKPQLYDYCKANQQLIELLEYWVDLLEDNGGEYGLVSAYDLGTLARVVRTKTINKAKTVMDWVFKADHYRAKYLRDNGMVNPAVIVSSKKLDANYALSQQKTLPALPKSVRRRSTIPTFDENGNLVGE
jgi:hypothetical protein